MTDGTSIPGPWIEATHCDASRPHHLTAPRAGTALATSRTYRRRRRRYSWVGSERASKSIQEILDRADELAQRLEDYEPEPGDERPVDEYLLERAALVRARGERQIVDGVTTARARGISWQRIGALLGTSAQTAQQRYGAVIETG